MKKRKKKLLTSTNPEELIEKYTHLAETGYISKLAQKICHLFFGWGQQTRGSERKVYVASGSFTAKIRGLFQLDKVLHPNLSEEELKKLINDEKLDEKNRENPRHHALDTIVLSIVPEIKFNPTKEKEEYPIWFNKNFCMEALENCVPHNIRFNKPKLAKTIYALRKSNTDEKKFVFVTRFGKGTNLKDYENITFAKNKVDSIYSLNIREDFRKKLEENPSPEEWKVFLHNYRAGGKPKKLLLISSSPFDEEEVKKFLNGEIKNLGEFIKGKMPGQFLKQYKETYGYYVYKDKKGKWRREPIYVFDSPYKKKKEIQNKYKDSEIYFFRTGMSVKLDNDVFVNDELRLSRGYYYLNTIGQNCFCKLTSIEGQKTKSISVANLIEQGKMKSI